MNPYAPAVPVFEPPPEPQSTQSAFKLTRTLLLDLIITCVYLVGLHRVSVRCQDLYFTGDGAAFFPGIANDFTALGAVIILALAMLGGQRQGYSKSIRFLAVIICIAFAFDFPTGQFTFATLLRSVLLVLVVFPMILFGQSSPFALSQACGRLLGGTAKRVGGSESA
jgi:hypothetical protein